ncbi:hypothetical protein BHM03_00027963 [Ensete ventricosum]|nr:hypothetical protein BHM03_00027963 [Ensete ventricosum]
MLRVDLLFSYSQVSATELRGLLMLAFFFSFFHPVWEQLSWSKSLVRRWFNNKSKAEDFHSDDVSRGRDALCHPHFCYHPCFLLLKVSVCVCSLQEATRHGVSASQGQKLTLPSKGKQEVVPLNAGNVLGTEDNAPARKWVALIRRSIDGLPGNGSSSSSHHIPSPVPNPIMELDDDFEGATTSRHQHLLHRRSFQSLSRSLRIDGDVLAPQPRLDRRHSVCERVIFANRPSDYDPSYRWDGSDGDDDDNISEDYSSSMAAYYSPMSYGHAASSSMEERDRPGHPRYLSKCATGKRCWKRTRYSLRASCDHEEHTLVAHSTLSLKQLRMERRCGRVFQGWNEGRIYFPPTYKYSNNSDRYAGDDMNLKEKRRTPAWYLSYKIKQFSECVDPICEADQIVLPIRCDRILWYGRGLNQLSYVRGESRFSDHRPVSSIFTAEVESINHRRIHNMDCAGSQVDIEQLLPFSNGYTQLGFF